VGNSIATAVVAKWEGELVSEDEAERHAAALDVQGDTGEKPLTGLTCYRCVFKIKG
jgi:hypothetical protein